MSLIVNFNQIDVDAMRCTINIEVFCQSVIRGMMIGGVWHHLWQHDHDKHPSHHIGNDDLHSNDHDNDHHADHDIDHHDDHNLQAWEDDEWWSPWTRGGFHIIKFKINDIDYIIHINIF